MRKRGAWGRRSGAVVAVLALALVLAGCDLRDLVRIEAAAVDPGARVLAADTAAEPDPAEFWGAIDCDLDSEPPQESGPQWRRAGGDPGPRANGRPQGDDAHRRVTVFDGDDFYGERCELGLNDAEGPVAFYEEGKRRVTHVSFRLPASFPLDAQDWQGVLQMKQAQPADNGGGTPVLSMSAFDGRWSLWHSDPGYTHEDFELWSTPAANGVWTRFAIDVLYSQDPEVGRVMVHVDLNDDGDFADEGERSPLFRISTLKREIEGDDDDGLSAGDSIPSHLRIGLYHKEVIPCPPPSGCSLDFDNLQVVRPPALDSPPPARP